MGGILYARQNTNADLPNVSGLMRSSPGSLHTKTAEIFLETFFGLTRTVGSVQCKDYRDGKATTEIEPLGETRIRKDYLILFGVPKSNIKSYFETKLCLGTVNEVSTRTGSFVRDPINFIVSIGVSAGFQSADFVQNHSKTVFEIKNGKSFPPGELFLFMNPCLVDDYDTPYPHEKKLGLNFVSTLNIFPDQNHRRLDNDVMRNMWTYSVEISRVLSMHLDEMSKMVRKSEEEYTIAKEEGKLILRH